MGMTDWLVTPARVADFLVKQGLTPKEAQELSRRPDVMQVAKDKYNGKPVPQGMKDLKADLPRLRQQADKAGVSFGTYVGSTVFGKPFKGEQAFFNTEGNAAAGKAAASLPPGLKAAPPPANPIASAAQQPSPGGLALHAPQASIEPIGGTPAANSMFDSAAARNFRAPTNKFERVGGAWMPQLQADPRLSLTQNQAAAIVGNLAAETGAFSDVTENASAANPWAGQPGKGGLGYAQWTGPRRGDFNQFRGGASPEDPNVNYEMVAHELTNSPVYSKELARLQATTGLKEAADTFGGSKASGKGYLRPGVTHFPEARGWATKAVAPGFEDIASLGVPTEINPALPAGGGLQPFSADVAGAAFTPPVPAVPAVASAPPAPAVSPPMPGRNPMRQPFGATAQVGAMNGGLPPAPAYAKANFAPMTSAQGTAGGGSPSAYGAANINPTLRASGLMGALTPMGAFGRADLSQGGASGSWGTGGASGSWGGPQASASIGAMNGGLPPAPAFGKASFGVPSALAHLVGRSPMPSAQTMSPMPSMAPRIQGFGMTNATGLTSPFAGGLGMNPMSAAIASMRAAPVMPGGLTGAGTAMPGATPFAGGFGSPAMPRAAAMPMPGTAAARGRPTATPGARPAQPGAPAAYGPGAAGMGAGVGPSLTIGGRSAGLNNGFAPGSWGNATNSMKLQDIGASHGRGAAALSAAINRGLQGFRANRAANAGARAASVRNIMNWSRSGQVLGVPQSAGYGYL
jgi:hypothetical protein